MGKLNIMIVLSTYIFFGWLNGGGGGSEEIVVARGPGHMWSGREKERPLLFAAVATLPKQSVYLHVHFLKPCKNPKETVEHLFFTIAFTLSCSLAPIIITIAF